MINLDRLKEEIKGMNVEEMARFLKEDIACNYCVYFGKVCYGKCFEGIKKYLLQETPKKYYWRLNVKDINSDEDMIYLNIFNNIEMELDNKREIGYFKTKFTEEEYKELSKKYVFPPDMFVKEEAEKCD